MHFTSYFLGVELKSNSIKIGKLSHAGVVATKIDGTPAVAK